MITNVLTYLEERTKINPNKIAVLDENGSLTYAQMLEKSRRIASAIIAKSVRRGEPIGVYMEKGVHAVSAFFGIVYAGGFYAMLNTELPAQRLCQIQSVMKANLILTTDDLVTQATELFPEAEIISVSNLKDQEIKEVELCCIRKQSIDTDPLYINFTSGSTGIPKGIVVSHRSVIDFIDCFTELFGITDNDVIANQAPFDFDVSVKDIYSAIKTGAELVIVPRHMFSEPVRLIDYLCEHKITTMIWAVSALCLISTFHCLDYKTPENVRKILFSGEVMPYKHLCNWQKHLPDALFVNLYGPTEITCNCTYHVLEKDRDYSAGIPIGKAFPNEDVFLLDDENHKITDTGSAGLIYVRGTALALGYYRLPEKNAECFVQNPLNDNYPETVYCTGDLGMFNEKGELLFCGRKDFQVKYLGHRIELEEIERAMSAIDGVERCCCVFDHEKSRLKGFYIGSIEKDELFARMKAELPIFMVPGYMRRVDEIPLTKNGKIDRKKLNEMYGGKSR